MANVRNNNFPIGIEPQMSLSCQADQRASLTCFSKRRPAAFLLSQATLAASRKSPRILGHESSQREMSTAFTDAIRCLSMRM